MKRMMLMVAAIAALSGCSGSVSGTVGGNSLPVADAIFAVLKDTAGKTTGAIIVLADKPKICDSLKANREPKSSTSMFFSIARITATDSLAPDVGDYTVIDTLPTAAGSFAFAGFSHTDTNCTNTLSGSASTGKSGLVKVTNFKGDSTGSANGTFDVTFGGGDKVTGSFNATFCDISTLQSNPNCE
ncbi:MAG: hypothetical protein U0228_03385 [Myxococcaceae bacterium]